MWKKNAKYAKLPIQNHQQVGIGGGGGGGVVGNNLISMIWIQSQGNTRLLQLQSEPDTSLQAATGTISWCCIPEPTLSPVLPPPFQLSQPL